MIPDYFETAGAQRKQICGKNGHEPGDPRKAAAIIVESAQDPKSPLRLLLGRIAVDVASKKADELKENVTAMADIGRSADSSV